MSSNKVAASVFKDEDECSSGDRQFINDSKEVMRKIYDATYAVSDLVRAQWSDLTVYGLRQRSGLSLDKEV